jgi:peptidoglycan/LPS O-acetylase OafA/YrhL
MSLLETKQITSTNCQAAIKLVTSSASVFSNFFGDRMNFFVIDFLRFFAAFAVLVFHFCFRGAAEGGFLETTYPEYIHSFAKYGFFGVHLFFLISGFVIAFSAQNRTALEFTKARVKRLWPTFVVCCTFTWVFLILFPFKDPDIASLSWREYLVNLTMVPSFFGVQKIDGAYWSLAVEIIFYLFVAVLISFKKIKHLVPAIFIWLVITTVNNHVLHNHYISKFLLTDWAPFFTGGIFIQQLTKKRDGVLYVGLVLSWLESVYLAVANGPRLEETYEASYSSIVIAAIITASFAAVLIASRYKRPQKKVLSYYLGGVTYPLYLLHQNVGYRMIDILAAPLGNVLAFLLTTTFMISAALLVFVMIEPSLSRLFQKVKVAV